MFILKNLLLPVLIIILFIGCSQTDNDVLNTSNEETSSTNITNTKPDTSTSAEPEVVADPLFPYMSAVNLLSAAQYEDAINQYNKVLRIAPDLALAYHGRGLAYHHLEQHALAMDDLNKSIQLDPEYADAYRNRGMILINQGQADKGFSDINKAINLYKTRGETAKLQELENILTRPTN